MFEQLMAVLREFEGQDEIFEVMARLYKKSFDALVKAGFSHQDAMRIVANMNFKS